MQSGFVAQEVSEAAKKAGYDFSGIAIPRSENEPYGLRYTEFVVPMVKAMQEQQALIVSLQQQVKTMKLQNSSNEKNTLDALAALQKKIEELEKSLAAVKK